MKRKTSPWPPEDLATLTALCERADRAEGRTTPPWRSSSGLPGVPLSQLLEVCTDTGSPGLLADVQAHPIYRRLTADVPRVVTVPADSPFDRLRRVWTIANSMSRPMPRKWGKTSSRPGRKREAERKAIRRLQQVTASPVRKGKLAEWVAQDMRRWPDVEFGKIAHPAVWWLAFELWTEADTADVQLLLEAARLVDPAGCDDSTARRYIKQARESTPKRPRPIRPAPASPVAPTPGLLGLVPPPPDK